LTAGADFFTRIAPFATCKSATVGLLNGVPTTIIPSSTPLGTLRYLLGFAAGNTTCPISLILTTTSFEYARIYAPSTTSFIHLYQLIQTDDLNALDLLANGAASAAVAYTVWFADVPPNILSNTVQGGVKP
jgi:hypothetical protein